MLRDFPTLVRHLSVDEIQSLLNAPTPTSRDGLRDRAMLHVCFAGGLRVSELIGLQLDSVTLHPHASVLVHGKGRRERCLPLWKETTAALRASWGSPQHINRTVTAYGTHEQWVYADFGAYVYLENGVVTSWQN